MKLYIKIADIVYEVTGDIPKVFGEELREYIYKEEPDGKHKLQVELKAISEFQPLGGTIVYQDWGYLILKPDMAQSGWLDPEYRIYMSKEGTAPAACYIETSSLIEAMNDVWHSGTDIRIEYDPRVNPVLDMTFMEFFSIDRHLACENAFILHSCFVEHEGKALIFTAPSGTGKSTQGNLWMKHAGAHVINGDRCILKLEEDGTCMAHSLPFCGSSATNHNRSYPVEAVVFLAQGPENVITNKASLPLLRRLMSQTTFSAWTNEATIAVMNIYDHFMKTVLFLEYACTPDESAVRYLASYLNKNCDRGEKEQ